MVSEDKFTLSIASEDAIESTSEQNKIAKVTIKTLISFQCCVS